MITLRQLRLLPILLCLPFAALGAAPARSSARLAVENLVRTALANTSQNARLAAINRVTKAGPAALPWLVSALKHADVGVREDAARALGTLHSSGAVQPLVAALSDPVDSVRSTAAEALGLTGDQDAVPALLKLMSSSDDMDRRGAAVALGTLGSPKAVPALETLCGSDNWEERWRAAVALGKIADRQTAPVVSRLTGDSNPVVAAAADWAIGAIAGTPSVRLLASDLTSANSAVVWGAAWALGVINTPQALRLLRDIAGGGAGNARDAAQTVLLWLGHPNPPGPASPTPAPPAAGTGKTGYLDLTGRWQDRYGRLDIRVTRPQPVRLGSIALTCGQAGPYLVRLGTGDVLLVYDAKNGDPGAARPAVRSHDGGLTWEPQATLVWRPADLGVLGDGTVLAYDEYAFHKKGRRQVIQMCISRDGGRSFGPLQLASVQLPAGMDGGLLGSSVVKAYRKSSARWSGHGFPAFQDSVIERADGSLLACGPVPAGGPRTAGLACYRSTDRGLTWTYLAKITDQNVSRPALVRAPDARLLCIVGNGTDDRMGCFVSRDGGATWGKAHPLPRPGVGLAVCKMSNGILACSFAGLDGVRIMFSIDGKAANWTDQITLVSHDTGPDAGTGLCEIGPGRLLLVYDVPGTASGAAPMPLYCAQIIVAKTGH